MSPNRYPTIAPHRDADVDVRVATDQDIDAALVIWVASNNAEDRFPVSTPEAEAGVRRRMTATGSTLLVGEQLGLIIGLILIEDGREVHGAGDVIPGLAHIGLVFVRPDVWGQGIGGHLVRAALSVILMIERYNRVQLWTQETNSRAMRLYLRHGFTISSDRGTDALGQTCVRLERSVSDPRRLPTR